MARTPLNEHYSAVLLKKLPEKVGDPGKFLISCDFPSMVKCLALADLGASINLMPFSTWKRLSLPNLTPTFMTLELADRSIARPVGVAEDVYAKVGSFYFPADFAVVDFDADPRVSLILERSFLKTGRATLRVGKEVITFNLDQTSRYSANYSDMTAKRIDVIDMACEEYSQEVLGFFDTISSGNPTPYYYPIVSTTSPTLTPFGNSDFILEKTSSATPTGRAIERSANSRVINIGVKLGRESLFHVENGIRLMLALRFASAKHLTIPGKLHDIKNLPGSPTFSAFSRFLSSFLFDGYGIEDFGFCFGALTGAITGSEIGEVTRSEVKTGNSD
nr:reverse transcriptase domain-containing protein [Tanacetum cinerariifolium]